MRRVEVPDPRQVHILAGDAAEIVPRVPQRRLDPGLVPVRERGAQVGAADPVRRQQRPDPPRDRRRTDRPRDPGWCGAAACSSHLTIRPTMRSPYSDRRRALRVRPAACRTRPGPPAAPARRGNPPARYTVSITGRTPAAIRSSARASADSGAPNEPMMRYCCWNNCIRLMAADGPGGGAAGHQPAAALQREQRAGPGVGAGMLEHHIDALACGQLAHHALEPVLAVVDDVVGAERLRLRRLVRAADGGDDGAADRLGDADGDAADAGAAGLHQDPSRRVRAGHCRTACAPRWRRRPATQAASCMVTPVGIFTTSRAGWLVRSWAKPSMWKPRTPATFSHRLSRPGGTAGQVPQISAAIGHDAVARRDVGHARRRPRPPRPPPRPRPSAGTAAWRRPCRESPRRRCGSARRRGREAAPRPGRARGASRSVSSTCRSARS